jgi:hypothetical protein
MILLQREQKRPAAIEDYKAKVIACLSTMHEVKEFDTRAELRQFLDQLHDELIRAGFPGKLVRVLLFYQDPNVVLDVAPRMVEGGQLNAFQAPACWVKLGARLPELTAWARRIEPDLVVSA